MNVPSTIKQALPPHITAGIIARIAREVVMEIHNLEDILVHFRISSAQYARIQQLPFFKNVVEDFTKEWNKISSTQERVRLISAVMYEEALPRLGAQMLDENVSPSMALETGKHFAKVAGVGEGKNDVPSSASERFVINISLGEQKLQFTKDVTQRAPTISSQKEPTKIPSHSEGQSDKEELQTIPERESRHPQEKQEPK